MPIEIATPLVAAIRPPASHPTATPLYFVPGQARKIAYVSPRYAPYVGGVETHVAELARRMHARGYQVEVLTQESDTSLPALDRVDGLTVRRFPTLFPSRNYTIAPELWSYLARHGHDYDLVHAHSYHALPALAAALARCRPLVFTPHYHGTGHSPIRRLLHVPYQALGARIFGQAQAVICVSEAEAALVRRRFPRVRDRITVIPNGVDVAGLRAAAPYPKDRTVILSAGRLEDYKNVHQTIGALAHLDESYVLRIVGDGPARARLEDLAGRLGLRERVLFLGRVSDGAVRRWFRTADVYVSMSEHEAFGITLLEALAAGSGVVASDIPAYREVAANAGSGTVTLTPLEATGATLAQAIRDAARARGGAHAAHVPSWDAVADRTLELYCAVLHLAA
jgi:glycosyltransferase involved in cell wall biosynthesis